ncbi:MAG: lactate utilization protein [Oscillospiraceae bacterium]
MDVQKLRKNLEERGFAVSYFETGAEAASYLASTLTGETIGIGGSGTVEALGLYELLGKNNQMLWHWKNPADKTRFAEFTTYLTSANAVAETGEVVNIDGVGNRTAATLYGPKKLYYLVGINKITPDLHSAIDRARKTAAPANVKRIGFKTPCAVDGICHDCRSPERACNAMVIQMAPMRGMEHTEVVLIGETLGL